MLRALAFALGILAVAGCVSPPEAETPESPEPAVYFRPAPAPPPPVAHETVQASLEPNMGLSCTDYVDVRMIQHHVRLKKGSEGLPFRFEAPDDRSNVLYSFSVTPYDGGESLIEASVQPGESIEGRLPRGPEPFGLTVWRCAAAEGSFAFTTWEA